MAVLAIAAAGAWAGSAIGATVGFAALGTSVGWAVGSYVGNLLFTPKPATPPAQELHLQTASNGAGIPICYGSTRTEAIIVDGSDIATRHEGSSGGKGGGSQPTPDTYSYPFIRVIWCESSGDHRPGREWHTGRIVADDRVGNNELPEVFYDGDPSQGADPTEEAILGVDEVSAYRHVASSVYADLNLGETGNALPNINREIIQGATEVDKPLEQITYNANSSGHQWDDNSPGNGDLPAITAWPASGSEDPIRVHKVNDTVTYTYDATTLEYIGSSSDGGDTEWGEDITSGGDWLYKSIGKYRGTELFIIAGHRVDGYTYDYPTRTFNRVPISSAPVPGIGSDYDGPDFLSGLGISGTERVCGAVLSQDGLCMLLFTATVASSGNVDKWYRIIDSAVDSSGAVNPTIEGSVGVAWGPRCGGGVDMGVVGGAMENDYTHVWLYGYNSQTITCYSVNPDTNDFEPAAVHTASLPGGSLTVTANNGGLCAIYALASGCKCGVIQGKAAYVIERCERTDGFVRLYDIVNDQHVRAGDASGTYDTSELIDIVPGLRVRTPASPRAVIESLQDLYGFAPCDSQGVVKYVKLGKPSILVIPDDDLCAHDENGSDIPSPLQVVLGNDIELPAQIFLSYFDYDAQYQLGVQNWHRQHTSSKIVRQIGLDITLTAKVAKQMVDAIGERTIREADKYTFYLLRKTAVGVSGDLIAYAQLEPTDVVTVKGLDLRITNRVDNQATGILKFEAVRSHPGVVIQTGAGGGESDGIPSPSIPIPQDTELVIGDWPWIEDEGRQRVVQVAMQGALRRPWKGAVLNKSSDGGTTYDAVLTDNAPATIGETLTALPNFGGGYVFDEGPGVQVLIHPGGGELASATRRAVLGGANFAMVGAEMIQFKTATLTDTNTYTLTGLLRGRHGTQWAMRGHAVGDVFCLLPTPLTLDALPVDYGFMRHYKAVTLGRTLASATAYPFRSNGVSLAPYSPVQLGAGFAGDPGSADITLRWRRRTRLGRGWVNARAPTGQDSMPLGEATEAYRVRIWEDGTFQTVVRTLTVTDARTLTYTAAMQVEDFGDELLVLPAWSVAQIGELGPGYEMYSNGLGAALPLFIPTDSDGYTPPIPPPADTILTLLDWATFPRVFSGSMGQNDVWSVQTTTGSNDSTVLVHLRAANWATSESPRTWALSTIRGDLVGTFGGPYSRGFGGNPDAGFTVGSHSISGYPQVPHNTTIYLNVANEPNNIPDFGMFCDLINRPA